ncbi:MAG: acyl-CoA dehydratase activase [Bacteroidetes bacterium]|nr:acyl-CoA dehydratase activase [Bacteroidota bacterium]MCL5026693.1 acyl-CoA dehydratase activase [Chloroflexota bacterium]
MSSDEVFLGLDIGSVNARLALVDGSGKLVHLDCERIYKGSSTATSVLLERAREQVPPRRIAGAGVTGSGRRIYDGQDGWQVFSSPYALIAGLLWDQPDAKTIIAIGGQSALVISLEDGLKKPWRVARSPLCAAGTGRFLEQQASRLGIPIEGFGARALEWEEAPPRIAARCSVFAKSDLIHLQQKGWPIPAMLAGLSDSVARMILAQWRDRFEPPVYCVGGVAGNQGVVRALSAALGDERVVVPPEHASREAIGAALLARRAPKRPAELFPSQEGDDKLFYIPRRLQPEFLPDGWEPADLGTEVVDVCLGVDVGSTSTKAAVISLDGEVLAKNYLMTAGQPLEAVKQVMANLAPGVEGKVRVRAVGVTGSGRYLVGSFIGADTIKNEITAQTKAALHIDPQIDTVFEVGGQDSKYVYLENGTVLDYQMNKACAAGTGSFIDELAEQLGISTRTGEFARLAFEAESQLDLGEKCTAFMSQAVTSAQHAGATLGCIVASLSTSLAKNYRSKVVGNRRVGNRIFLTGAVFYNEAVVSSFKAELQGKTFVVPVHKEVTGAIGAALLARDAQGEAPSRFKGFSEIAQATYKLSNFTCHLCENSCAISTMTTEGGARLFYGSRCDRFDAAGAGPKHRKVETPFTEREALLFGGYEASGPHRDPHPSPLPGGEGTRGEARAGAHGRAPLQSSHSLAATTPNESYGTPAGTLRRSRTCARFAQASPIEPFFHISAERRPGARVTPLVGVPRALMTYDIAPLMTEFLTALGARVAYSPPTNKRLIEKSLELAYTDSCFPVKLLHGHVAELLEQGAEYVLIPNAIRMGEKEGDADQRYSCPLVQAAPYIVRSVFHLGDRLLDPVIDFSKGDGPVIGSLAAVAGRLGFEKEKGLQAAVQALEGQRQFEERLQTAGRRLLEGIAADPDALGVVLLSRAYNAQDEGANLGIAAELQKLGVVPVPLDYLPLEQVSVREMSDRPYWNYERKILAAAKLIAENPQLFGLFLSNFGCGPNSFIQNFVEDIMGGKPLGQIEVDEHAAEAGYITRLEALADTIRGYRKAGLQMAGDPAKYARKVPTAVRPGENIFIPRMADHAEAVAAAMRAFGVNAQVLPESDERSMGLSRDATSGKECLPFRDTLGVMLRMAYDGALPRRARALMAGSFGPCRLGKYAQEQQKILDDRGIELEVMATVSNNAYSDLGLGLKFYLMAWEGAVAIDHLQRLLWSTRPYERYGGQANQAYAAYLSRLLGAIEARRPIERLMREAMATFAGLRDHSLPRRPLVGINGEIYLRANRFCNKDVVGLCEANGLEVEVAPMSEWMKYTSTRNVEDAWANRELKRLLKGVLRKLALEHYEGRVAGWFDEVIHEREPGTKDLLAASSLYLPSRNGSEAVLSLGSGVRQMRDPHYAAVISVMPHGCMPGGIVAALAEQISKEYGHKPWISLTYDGFPDKVNPERVADLAEQLKHRSRESGHESRQAR